MPFSHKHTQSVNLFVSKKHSNIFQQLLCCPWQQGLNHISHITLHNSGKTQKTFHLFRMIKGKRSSIHASVCVCVCTEYKTVLESTVIMKIHEADYRVKVWLQALEDGSVVVTKVRTLPKVHIRDGWPLLKSSNLVLPLANQCCHDVISCGSRVISHMMFTPQISSHIFQPSNCHWNKWKCIAESRYILFVMNFRERWHMNGVYESS